MLISFLLLFQVYMKDEMYHMFVYQQFFFAAAHLFQAIQLLRSSLLLRRGASATTGGPEDVTSLAQLEKQEKNVSLVKLFDRV